MTVSHPLSLLSLLTYLFVLQSNLLIACVYVCVCVGLCVFVIQIELLVCFFALIFVVLLEPFESRHVLAIIL